LGEKPAIAVIFSLLLWNFDGDYYIDSIKCDQFVNHNVRNWIIHRAACFQLDKEYGFSLDSSAGPPNDPSRQSS
jgi:hypothetical protein